MTTENKQVDQIDEEDAYDKDRYAVKNGKAVKDNPAHVGSSNYKDQPHHVWATSPEEALKKATKKEEVDTSDVDALFSDENLSEEFKTTAKSIFEAAVLAKVEEQKSELQEQFEKQLEEQTEEFAASLVEKLDDYLNYVVSEWMENNQVAIQKNLKTEIAEDFMAGLKNLFVENHIDLPEEKVDVVEELTVKLDEIQSELDKAITLNSDLTEQLNVHKKSDLIKTVSEGLSEIQSEKLKSLAENIEFVSEEDYKQKLLLTKKKYFEQVKSEEKVESPSLDSDASTTLDESVSPAMAHYVQSISRTLKK